MEGHGKNLGSELTVLFAYFTRGEKVDVPVTGLQGLYRNATILDTAYYIWRTIKLRDR